MTGVKDLETLLQEMAPELQEGEYVFVTLPESGSSAPETLKPLATFREREGLTLVLHREEAERHRLPYESTLRWITLTVHSSLEAVGLTAAVATALTERQISANVIAAYYHDHLFVPTGREEEALEALRRLAVGPS